MANVALDRSVVVIVTNKSGGSLAQGDVVVLDTTTAASVTTTTSSGYAGEPAGVVIEPNGIANNAQGRVCFVGFVPIINLSSSASLGDFVKTHSVAKQGVRHATPAVAGDFAMVLGTGATPAAYLFGTNFVAGGGGTPASPSQSVQYNNAGAFAAVALNATATAKYLQQVSSGAPSFAQVADADLSVTNVTTNNVSITAHGFAPKAPNDATKYLDGTGAYSVPAGGTSPNHAYFGNLAAFLDPDTIEAMQIGAFSYVIGPTTTKWLLLGWELKIGGNIRLDIRDPRIPLPLRGVTVAGVRSTSPKSTALFMDPTLVSYANAYTRYYDCLNTIATLATQFVSITAQNQTVQFLPGPYGNIITSVTCFDLSWVALGSEQDTGGGFPIDYEISDANDIRFAHTMNLPVTKAITNRVISGAGTAAGAEPVSGSITHVILPSSYSTLTDPLAPYTFRDDFTEASLDTSTIWTRAQSTAGNVEINTAFAWCKVIGDNATWGPNGAYTQSSFARSSQPHLLIDFCMALTTSSSFGFIIGWSDGGGQSYTNFAHGILAQTNSTFVAFENGTNRGAVGSGFTKGFIYRLRLRALSGGGATYEIQGGPEYGLLGGAAWTTITPGTTSSATSTLHAGFAAAGNDVNQVGDVRVY